jgi:peroxiredoxin Q/BCP
MIDAGDIAPDFTLPAVPDGSLTLSDLYPRKVVLFFYPKDNTPACTDEAVAFSAAVAAFARAGAAVVGCSRDSLRKHANFTQKQGLQVPLVADVDGKVCDAYGVWGRKQMYGKFYMGIIRSTFLIGGDGRIIQVWSPVKVPGHADEVLTAVQA